MKGRWYLASEFWPNMDEMVCWVLLSLRRHFRVRRIGPIKAESRAHRLGQATREFSRKISPLPEIVPLKAELPPSLQSENQMGKSFFRPTRKWQNEAPV